MGCPYPHSHMSPWGASDPSLAMLLPGNGLLPGSGQAPSDTCRSSSAMYPWSPPAPTTSNIACGEVESGDTKVGSCHGAGGVLEQCTHRHPASSCSFNPAGRCPGPCLTFQSPSAWTVAWLRCQVSPSIVLMLNSFLNTPLSSTRMLRDPAQGPPARLDACCAVAWCIASTWPPGAYPSGAAPQDPSILC